jgi:hypothetical protein
MMELSSGFTSDQHCCCKGPNYEGGNQLWECGTEGRECATGKMLLKEVKLGPL